MKKYTLAFDFDGVFHDLDPRQVATGSQAINGPEIDNATQHIKLLLEQYYIFIMTARLDLKAVKKWLEYASVPSLDGQILKCEIIEPEVTHWEKDGVLGITNRKLPALAYIDDRAVRFTNWKDIVTHYFH